MSVVCVGCGRDEVYGWEGWRFGDVEGYFRGAVVVVVVVVDFIILLGESQQAVPFYWEP